MMVIPRHSPKLGTSQGDAKPDDELLLRWWWCSLDKLFNKFLQILKFEGKSANQFRVLLNAVHDHVGPRIPVLVILSPLFLLRVSLPCMVRTRHIPNRGQVPFGHLLVLMLMYKSTEGSLVMWRR